MHFGNTLRDIVARRAIHAKQKKLYLLLGQKYFSHFRSNYDVAFDAEMSQLLELDAELDALVNRTDVSQKPEIICPRCGKSVPYDTAYCVRCGTLLNPDKIDEVEDVVVTEDDGREGIEELEQQIAQMVEESPFCPSEYADDEGTDVTVRDFHGNDDDLDSFFGS